MVQLLLKVDNSRLNRKYKIVMSCKLLANINLMASHEYSNVTISQRETGAGMRGKQ